MSSVASFTGSLFKTLTSSRLQIFVLGRISTTFADRLHTRTGTRVVVSDLSALTTLGQRVSFDDNPSSSMDDVNADSALRFFRTRPVTVLDALGFSVNFFVVFTTPTLSLQIELNAVFHSARTASDPSHVIS